MEIEEIKKQLDGYFINKINHNGIKVTESLCKKTDNKTYQILDNVRTPKGVISAMDNCLMQVNNQILEPGLAICHLSEILIVINGDVFESYNTREKAIEKHIQMCEEIETEDNQFSDGKYIIKWKRPKGFTFAIVNNDNLTEISEDLLDDHQKESAVRIQYPKLVQKAIKDDLNNEFEVRYLEEVEKYQNI